jgi:signal transduction histidine kinase
VATTALSADLAPGLPRSRPALLRLVAAAGFGVAASSVGFALANTQADGVSVALIEWITVPYLVAGLLAQRRRPESRLGPLMITGALAIGLSGWQFAEPSVPYTIGAAFDIVPAAIFLHVFLAFPDGRLRSRVEQALVGGAYAVAIGLQLAKMVLGAVPHNLLEVAVRPDAANAVEGVQLLSLSGMCLAGVVVLAARRRRSGRPRLRLPALLIDVSALGLVLVAVLFGFAHFDAPAFKELQHATLLVIGASAIVFLIGLLDARLARSAIGNLVLELRTEPPPADLRNALARALRDPSLALAYWLPDFRSYVGHDGQAVELPDDDERTSTPIDREGERVAVLIHDRALDDERELLDAAVAAAGIALENGRLQAELAARLEEVKGSRARVIEAGQRERQRLERNLHDGAQQRLIALSLHLTLLEQRLGDDPGTRRRLDEARREIALSLDELRTVARGLHPAVLSGHGLAVALESIAARAPLPVRLDVKLDSRLPEPVEVAAYYVVSESLANVAKHAAAGDVSVSVARTGDDLVVEIVDDGVGGADTERGTGIRGLADRVEALDGRLRIWTPVGGGTRVRAEIPCG